MQVGSYFLQGSFTNSTECARAALSIGVTFRETPGSSQCFLENVDRGIEITIQHQSTLLAEEGTIAQVLTFVYPSTR